MIAVNDGKIVAMGENARWDAISSSRTPPGTSTRTRNLGSVSATYPVPKPVRITAKELASELSSAPAPTPTTAGDARARSTLAPASAGHVRGPRTGVVKLTAKIVRRARPGAQDGREAGGARADGDAQGAAVRQPVAPGVLRGRRADLQINSAPAAISSFQNYFSDTLHLARNQYTLQPLRVGSIVVAGTILARIGGGARTAASHMMFMIRPAGRERTADRPQADPRRLEAAAGHEPCTARADIDPFFGSGAKNPTIGQVLLMSKEQLEQACSTTRTSRSTPAGA